MIPPVLLPWGEGVAVRPGVAVLGVAVLGVAGLLQWRVVAGAGAAVGQQQQRRSLGLVPVWWAGQRQPGMGTLHQPSPDTATPDRTSEIIR